MVWLILHMWVLLLSAFVIGVGTGWWIGRGQSSGAQGQTDEPGLGTLDLDAPKSPEA